MLADCFGARGLRRRALERLLGENLGAGLTDLLLDLVRDAGSLREDVNLFRDVRVRLHGRGRHRLFKSRRGRAGRCLETVKYLETLGDRSDAVGQRKLEV